MKGQIWESGATAMVEVGQTAKRARQNGEVDLEKAFGDDYVSETSEETAL